MNTKETLLNDQLGNTLVTDQASELITIENIAGTPFDIVSTEGRNFVALGKYRLTEEYETKDEAIEMLNGNNWEFIVNLVTTVVSVLQEESKTNKQ